VNKLRISPKQVFFSVEKVNNIFIPIIVISSQNYIRKYGTKGHEQVSGQKLILNAKICWVWIVSRLKWIISESLKIAVLACCLLFLEPFWPHLYSMVSCLFKLPLCTITVHITWATYCSVVSDLHIFFWLGIYYSYLSVKVAKSWKVFSILFHFQENEQNLRL
jgi:hypothetical protein